MPIPASINDLSTTAAINSPGGAEDLGTADDYLRTYASYIAALRDVVLSGTANLSTANLTYTGTLTGSTGVLNIGSGQIYKDASGNLGLGTTSPGTRLHAVGQIVRIQDSAATVQLFKDATPTKAARLSFNVAATDAAAIGVYNGSAWTDAIVVDGSANVGIGLVPLVTCDIGGTTAIRSSLEAGQTLFTIANQNTGGYGIEQTFIAHSGADVLIGNRRTGGVQIWTDGSERWRVDSSGNVGIGTASPGAKLHVAGEVRLDATTSTSATAGANGDVPAQVVGYITVNIAGTNRKIPYYAA